VQVGRIRVRSHFSGGEGGEEGGEEAEELGEEATATAEEALDLTIDSRFAISFFKFGIVGERGGSRGGTDFDRVA